MDGRPGYEHIAPAGGDTATPKNLAKRLGVIERYASVAGKRVVDCGCGAGEYVRAMRTLGAHAWGIEFSQEKVASAGGDVGGRLTVGDLHDIAVRSESIDVALMNEVIEHVPDDRRALGEVHRILRPGGTLVMFSPNRLYPFETHGTTLRGSGRRVPHYTPLIPYIPLALASTILEFWARNYWPRELRGLVKGAGFTITHTDYVWQTFEGISQRQPSVITRLKPLLQAASSAMEQVPLVRAIGVSQVIVAVKPS